MNIRNEFRNTRKSEEALKTQRFQMLQDIARELSGDVVFPPQFDVILQLRKALNSPDRSISEIAAIIASEPLVSAKLLCLANSPAFTPTEQAEVVDLQAAVARLGIGNVLTTTLAIVIAQLLRTEEMLSFAEQAEGLWKHSLYAAAWARIIAREKSTINPEEAMLTGLIHDIGAIYMLYRATQYEELRQHPDSLRHLVIQWHESIGVSLLEALGLPEEIVKATQNHDCLRTTPASPSTLTDIIYVSNVLSGGHFEMAIQGNAMNPNEKLALDNAYVGFKPEVDALITETLACFA
jgi:putative nucleotidyltransferase with HDIG domain